jgi:L-fuconolactonase
MLIDSHHHLWKYSEADYGWISPSMQVLRRDYLLSELRDLAQQSGVSGFVSVEARQSVQETIDLLSLADKEPLIRGVVGWLPLADPNVNELIDQFQGSAKLKGVRHVVQDEPDDRFLLNPDFNRGVNQLAARGLVYDILIFARQLPASIEFADRHPDVPMVLDHIAKPVIRAGQVDAPWEAGFRALAKREHVSCKFSGMVTEVRDEQWTVDTIRPYWDIALEVFTPQRLMFGSDWPVCLLRAEHRSWLDTVRQLAKELSPSEQADLFANTATRIYRLSA